MGAIAALPLGYRAPAEPPADLRLMVRNLARWASEFAALEERTGVRVPKGVTMWVKGEPVVWQEGKCVVFSGSDEHEVVNSSTEPRVVLLADFQISD